MLVQISVRNFKVFKDEAKLTLFASNYDKSTREQENVFEASKFGLRLLKSAVIYGANASGKTKLIDAVHFMKDFILNSSKESQQGEPIDVEPFRLSTVTAGQPSMFEIVFIHEGDMYRYGFEVARQKVASEWLYHRPNTKEVEIFFREGQTFAVHPKFKKGRFLVDEGMVRNNALMLSVAAQFNDQLAQGVLAWFGKFHQISGLHEVGYMGYSMVRIEDSKKKIISLLKLADIGIEDIIAEKYDASNLPETMPEELKEFIRGKMRENKSAVFFADVKTFHSVFDEDNNPNGLVEFSLGDEESSGTMKFFALIGPLTKALETGEVLIVDELDSKLHPTLVEQIVRLFNSRTTNPHNAQLIFNTHDTNLLGSNLFRRDQIWFIEKDRFGAASLYSLASFKTDEGGRKTDNFEEKYLQGRYGGVPLPGDFSEIFQPERGMAP